MAAAWLRRFTERLCWNQPWSVGGFERTCRGGCDLHREGRSSLVISWNIPAFPSTSAFSAAVSELPRVSLVSSLLSYLLTTKRWVPHASKRGRRTRGSDQEKLTWSEDRGFPERERSGNRKVTLDGLKKSVTFRDSRRGTATEGFSSRYDSHNSVVWPNVSIPLKWQSFALKINLSLKQNKPNLLHFCRSS